VQLVKTTYLCITTKRKLLLLERKSLGILFLLILLSMTVASCGSSKKSAQASDRGYRDAVTDERWTFKAEKNKEGIASTDLVEEARRWLGTPYRYGGKSRSGTDCSGFVMEVYLKATAIKLPRTTYQQREYCDNIKKGDLKPGDLVFFSSGKGKGKVSHVGMYVGAGQIIHASSSRGVILSKLSEPYYARNYHSSGRVRSYRYKESGTNKSAPGKDQMQIANPPIIRKDQISLYELLDEAVEHRADSIYSNLID